MTWTAGARDAERGAAATLVAILAAGGVLLGMLALSVDVGNMMFERRQLQNGADATAMALAQLCAEDLAQCDPALTVGALAPLNDANAVSDATHGFADRPDTINGQCGRVPGANMPWCDSVTATADITDLAECPALPAWLAGAPTIPYVETYTRSQSSAGPVLDFFFTSGETTIVNCARAAWGGLGSADVLPLTFRDCEFDEAITSPGYGVETSLPLKYGKDDSCDPTTASSGGDFAGGFGWMNELDCEAAISTDMWVDADTGVGAGTGCLSQLNPGDTILIPIFDCISDSKTLCVPGAPTGTNVWYHIDRFEAFYVTGHRITGTGAGTYLPGYPTAGAKSECDDESLDKKCLYGWFIEDYVANEGEIDPDAPLDGVNVVLPAG